MKKSWPQGWHFFAHELTRIGTKSYVEGFGQELSSGLESIREALVNVNAYRLFFTGLSKSPNIYKSHRILLSNNKLLFLPPNHQLANKLWRRDAQSSIGN